MLQPHPYPNCFTLLCKPLQITIKISFYFYHYYSNTTKAAAASSYTNNLNFLHVLYVQIEATLFDTLGKNSPKTRCSLNVISRFDLKTPWNIPHAF